MKSVALPEQTARTLPKVQLAGVSLHALTEVECVEHILSELAAQRGGWVVTPNLDHLRRYQCDPAFQQACDAATLRVPDGRPLLWAAHLQGTPLPGLVAGSNLIHSLTRAAANSAHSVFLLGGDAGTAEDAARILITHDRQLRIAGTYCPEFGFEKDAARLAELEKRLAESEASIVFVALGSPKQEYVIQELRRCLPRAWWLGVGISFSFVSGAVQRAPQWVQRCGLEWLHRLIQEPRRLARRYLLEGIPFALRLLAKSFVRGVFGFGGRP